LRRSWSPVRSYCRSGQATKGCGAISNCVFKPTAGAMLVSNRPALASGGLTRRYAR
jgi:hypothetical protein